MNPREDKPRVEIMIIEVQGSAPREPGTRMVWFAGGSAEGTIGGGNLEQQVLNEAEALWNDPDRKSALLEFPLSARLGQCCGGWVRVFLVKRLPACHALICGAGHVGAALAKTLAGGPLSVTVVDSRSDWASTERFPESARVMVDDPEAAVRDWADRAERTCLLIMTHEHRLDQALCQLGMRYPFKWIGLIGSRTKWLRFRKRLAARGFSDEELGRIVSPIGNPALGRTPHEIAVGVAAQLLAVYHGVESRTPIEPPSSPPGRRAALILAGGASRRMGRWKGGLPIQGEPLVRAHARVAQAAGAETWMAIYPEMYREEAERIIPPGRRIVNSAPEAPLFASLQLGLRELIREHPDVDSVLMTPVDMIPLDEDWIAALWDRHEQTGAWATRPLARTGDRERPRAHGHPVILDQRLFAPILAADPDSERLDFFLRDLPAERTATLELSGGAALINLNTPEDLSDALAE